MGLSHLSPYTTILCKYRHTYMHKDTAPQEKKAELASPIGANENLVIRAYTPL